jgi:hypothetical protein
MIFNESKYTTTYFNIINRAKTRNLTGYKERHHIIPRSLGGDDSYENLVDLTGREHYIVHWLLIKMTDQDAKSKMLYAFWRMCTTKKYRVTARTYEMIKHQNGQNHSQRMSGKNNPFYGKHHTPERVAEIRARNRLQKWSEERRQLWAGRYAGENNPMYGKTHTTEARVKISEAASGRVISADLREQISKKLKGIPPKVNESKVTCPHCGKEMDLGNAKRHHFDNCKQNPDYIPKPKRTYHKVSRLSEQNQ